MTTKKDTQFYIDLINNIEKKCKTKIKKLKQEIERFRVDVDFYEGFIGERKLEKLYQDYIDELCLEGIMQNKDIIKSKIKIKRIRELKNQIDLAENKLGKLFNENTKLKSGLKDLGYKYNKKEDIFDLITKEATQ